MNELIKVGAKVRRNGLLGFIEITGVGNNYFFGYSCERRATGDILCDGDEKQFSKSHSWLPYEEPKKTVMMYPALLRDADGRIFVSVYMYESEEQAKAYARGYEQFIKLLTDRGIEIEVW
jgi:hypothetical protein